ncbi:hypothetical protein C8R45DRAFT_1108352 [Mycena sanguinolenta]|nr:hypothetical protein C8R45DRAFT_1108352 [Mycena sanguinolenta]
MPAEDVPDPPALVSSSPSAFLHATSYFAAYLSPPTGQNPVQHAAPRMLFNPTPLSPFIAPPESALPSAFFTGGSQSALRARAANSTSVCSTLEADANRNLCTTTSAIDSSISKTAHSSLASFASFPKTPKTPKTHFAERRASWAK